jgi:hypothetical protein
MKTHAHHPKLWLVLILCSLIALSACGGSTSSEEMNPIVNDPDLEINVTPQPEGKYGYFTIVVRRVGEQAPKIGWNASGEVYLRVSMELGDEDADDTQLVSGTGFGTAGFDASTQICTNLGGWPVEYSAEGQFNVKTCQLDLKIEETWPKTEALSNCIGGSGSVSGGIYNLTFPSLKFTADDTREDTTTTKDMITWINTFMLYPKDGLEDAGCEFSDPNP